MYKPEHEIDELIEQCKYEFTQAIQHKRPLTFLKLLFGYGLIFGAFALFLALAVLCWVPVSLGTWAFRVLRFG